MPWPAIIQEASGYACCQVIALLNALRFWGYNTCAPGSTAFEHLADLARCRYGPPLRIHRIHAALGLQAEIIAPRRALVLEALRDEDVVTLDVWSKHYGLHTVLLTEVSRGRFTVVGLEPTKTPTRLRWSQLERAADSFGEHFPSWRVAQPAQGWS